MIWRMCFNLEVIFMNMRIIQDISDFIFVEDKVEKADVIMIPGGSFPELPEKAAELWNDGYAPIVVPAGGVSIKTGRFNGVKSKREIYAEPYKTECEFYTDVLEKCGVKSECIVGDDKSGCTADNARFTKKVLDSNKIYPKKAILCCKAFHARRCLMFYQFYFPHTEFIVVPVVDLPGYHITKDNWYKTDIGLSRVLGELSRLGDQFELEFNRFKDELDKN